MHFPFTYKALSTCKKFIFSLLVNISEICCHKTNIWNKGVELSRYICDCLISHSENLVRWMGSTSPNNRRDVPILHKYSNPFYLHK